VTASGQNPSQASGNINFTATDSNGNNSTQGPVSYTVIDPYYLSVTQPTHPTIDSTAPFTVTVKPNSNAKGSFSGSVAFTSGSGTSCSPTTVSPGSSTTCSVTFTTVSPAGLSAGTNTNDGAFTLSVPSSSVTLISPPYSVAVTSGTAYLTGELSQSITVQVTSNGTYNSSVTIKAPATLPAGIASITGTVCEGAAQPARLSRGVSSLRSASGTYTPPSVTVLPGGSACFTVTGSDVTVS